MSREEYYSNLAPMTDGADLFIRVGFAPDVVKLTNLYNGTQLRWSRAEHGHYAGAAASGGLMVSTGGTMLLGPYTGGIALCEFTGGHAGVTWGQIDYPGDPPIVDGSNWIDANGIKVTASCPVLETDQLLQIEAWRMNHLYIKAYHEGGASHTTFRDDSFDFKELGVSGNGNWILYNQTNGNYAYVKQVRKGNGKSKWSLIDTATDADGTATTAATFANNNVIFLFPVNAAPFPMGDIGAMT